MFFLRDRFLIILYAYFTAYMSSNMAPAGKRAIALGAIIGKTIFLFPFMLKYRE